LTFLSIFALEAVSSYITHGDSISLRLTVWSCYW